jgi:hypothetical protein
VRDQDDVEKREASPLAVPSEACNPCREEGNNGEFHGGAGTPDDATGTPDE